MSLAKVQILRSYLMGQFPERQHVIDGSLAAILAGQHVLMLGPPGTAKSALTRAISGAFGARYFERLLTKFSTPEELFGPVSLKAMEQDRYSRNTTGKLPEAEVVFADEVFKSNSAILNSLLTAMNERLFHNDGAPIKIPLVSLFGASNELPEGKELEALFDRFMVRFDVRYLVDRQNFRSMLTAGAPGGNAPSMTMADLRAAQREAAAVQITDATVDALIAVRDALAQEGIVASDRRWKQTLSMVQAYAALAGQTATCPEDLVVLTDMLWREPKDRSRIARTVGSVADPVTVQVLEILDAARETAQTAQATRTGDRNNFLAAAGKSLEALRAQQTKLAGLLTGAGPRARQSCLDAQADVQALTSELARAAAAGLGLGGKTKAA